MAQDTPSKKSNKHLTAKELGLNHKQLPYSIIEVIKTLNRAGFSAYIVGGGVRDSLLGFEPKDFDAVTDARPHEIKKLFGGRCRIVGKRFPLAHVYSSQEMIEVVTFRGDPKDNTHTTEGGMITRDNVWGTIDEDAARRDFSINALYYEPLSGQVRDFCGGLDDISNRKIRLIGKAKKRIDEDPVRLLRALRFKAKLGFEFDKFLAKQFHQGNWDLMKQVSTHRLFDESQKMFTGGYLYDLLPLLYHYGAISCLVAEPSDTPTKLMMHVAKITDERIKNNKGANPAYFYAVLLWESYLRNLTKFKKQLPFYDAQIKAASRTIDRQRTKTAIPRFAEAFITQIWLMQPKLSNPKPKDVVALIKNPKFRAAYDFLVARELADDCQLAESTNKMGRWWTDFQNTDEISRQKMLEMLGGRKGRRGTQQHLAEFEQIMQLSLDNHTIKSDRRKPLFGGDNANAGSINFGTKVSGKTSNVDCLTPYQKNPSQNITWQYYSDEQLLALLIDEPYIPSTRHHKRAVK